METTSEERRRQRELSNARTQKSGYERDKAKKESICHQNNEKISRLKTVKAELEAQKKIAKARYKELENYAKDELRCEDWIGDKKERAVLEYQDTIVPWYKDYIDRVDEVLDAVCDEITRLQNQNMQLNGDILHLASLINSLVNQIRMLCN